MTTEEMIVTAIQALQARGYDRPGNMHIQRAIWNIYNVHVTLETISYYTDRG